MTFTVKIDDGAVSEWKQAVTELNECPYQTWVGFKDSFGCIEKYEILANGISKYTQSYPVEESFITNCCATDTIKKADLYSKARHKDVWKNKFGNKCGQVLNWNWVAPTSKPAAAVTEQEVNLKLKIDLRRFLILSNIRYLPAFAGKIELKLMFGTNGLVVAPIDPKFIVKGDMAKLATFTIPQISQITNQFVQINEEFKMIVDWKDKSDTQTKFEKLEADVRCISVVDRSLRVDRCESTIYCFGLVQNLYDQLVQRYTSMTLTYPTQVLSFSPMSGKLDGPTWTSLHVNPHKQSPQDSLTQSFYCFHRNRLIIHASGIPSSQTSI
jgi:hypothetical protein